MIAAAARRAWPEDPETAVAVARCESSLGQHPATYDTEAENGGPMQLNGAIWAPYFAAWGWSWEQVVTDLETHMLAAREVYDRGGGWGPWACGL